MPSATQSHNLSNSGKQQRNKKGRGANNFETRGIPFFFILNLKNKTECGHMFMFEISYILTPKGANTLRAGCRTYGSLFDLKKKIKKSIKVSLSYSLSLSVSLTKAPSFKPYPTCNALWDVRNGTFIYFFIIIIFL